ncbi:hypothetical protein F9L07_15300 [Pimelobacter simplex]|uniref:Carbohydrate-binding module family 96 domain-containing protein n=1 Tax=Nocardioides simplex TaxID=2045 RepID=A0A7J5E476_NOCSI|nr:RHS repeat-associated core domain-containing protein [Pimelobacter simplex]KAB2813059.1 hypothetical protein F9L07_15300 [Pimelobacter simplex]
MQRHVSFLQRAFAGLIGLLGLALMVTGLAVPAEALRATSAAPDPVKADDSVRPDAVSAMVTARATGEPVEDLSQRTETVRVFAQPDGSWVSDGTTEPERVQRADGTWHEIDTALEPASGGGLAPVASVSDVRFSSGGDRVFAALADERGKRLEWRWPTVLPEPTIDGGTATYPDALAGLGDLVVTATSTGFTHNIVIPERPDESAGPVEVKIPVATRGAGLVENPGGEIAIETPKGDTLVASSRPLMWDSSENEGGDPVVAPVETAIGETPSGTPTLTLTADESLLNDPETVYPVIIDPSFTINPSGDTWVQTPNYTSSQHASQELKAGTYDGGAHKARSFLRFDNGNAKWAGVNVLDAKLKLRNFYSGSCTGAAIRVNRIIEAWSVTGLTWGNQPSVGAMSADYNKAFGYNSSCDTADATWDMTEIVRGWNGGLVNNGVRVAAVNESSNFTWRRYRSAEVSTASVRPRLIVSYNSYPNKPATPSLTPGNPGYTTSTTPTFKTTVSDPDGGNVRAVFEVYQGSTLKWSGTTGYVSSGAAVSKAMNSGLANGATYTVKVKANDGTNDSKAYSASTTFTVDTSKPTVALTSTAFVNNQWRTEPPASNTFTFTGSGDTASFAYALDGIAQPAKAADSTGKATLSWLPKNGAHTLSVTPTDKAGNVGTATTFKFGVGPAAFTTPNLAARSTGVFPVQVSGPPNAIAATLSWRYAGSTTWNPATDVKKASGDWDESVANTADGTASTTGALTWNAAAEKADPADPDSDKKLSAPAFIEVRACFTYSGGTPEVCTSARQVQLVPSAFGGSFPVTDLGPATVALFTGELSLTEPDAVDATAGAGRIFSSYDPSTTSPGAFGPGWSTGLFAAGDTTDLLDHRNLDGTFVLVTTGDASQTFTQDGGPVGGKTTFVPAEGDDGSRLVIDAGATPKTATLTRAQATVTTWTLDDATESWVLQSAAAAESASDPEVGFEFSAPGYPTFIAETEPGVATTCTPATQSAGCRALRISYTGSGENERVSKIERLAHGTPATTLATYSYDSQGRLTSVCDPRTTPQLCTTYTYAIVGGRTLLATATPAGQKSWRFSYDNTGRVINVKRQLDPAAGTGDATWTVVYELATSASGLPSMTATATTEWGQDAAPTKVFATFGPDTVPGASPTSEELKHAALWYTDEQGITTNNAVYGAGGWLVNTSWYDARGNIVRQLDGAGRARALEGPVDDRSDIAYDASSLTFYNSDSDNDALDARRIEDVYGPVHTVTLKDGTVGPFRAHTSYTYDDEEPSLGGGSKPALPDGRPAFDLIVEAQHSAAGADLVGDSDVAIVRNNYAPAVTGDGNGWTLGRATEVQTKVANGSWSTRSTRYDARGRVIETRQPGGAARPDGSGADARSTVTSYYEPSAGDSDCNTTGRGKPNWVGLVCKTGPAAQPTGSPVPTTFQAAFDSDLRPTRVEERSGPTTRVTLSEYDDLGRSTSQTVRISSSSRTTTMTYDAATGLPVTASGEGGTVTTGYDSWARVTSYTDATGLTSATKYTVGGQVATQSDGVGTYSYTYGGGGEHRPLPTSISVGGGVTGSFALSYNAAGAPTTITYANGIKRTHTYDEIGVPTGLAYTAADDTELLSFSNVADVDGRVVAAASAATEQNYTYDALGRLTKVEDNRTEGCTTRTYGFSVSSERTGFQSYDPGPDGACQSSTPTLTKTSTYDTVSRIRNAGYAYDDLGRTLSIPAADTAPGAVGPLSVAYDVNDMVKKVTQTVDDGNAGTLTRETSYELDPQGRINLVTERSDAAETSRARYRFADSSDAPTSIQTSTDAGTTWNTTRYVVLPGLGMVASHDNATSTTTWQLSNLHGDAVATVTGSGIDSYDETDEYGNALAESTPRRYGWLGSFQRSAEGAGGVMLMGARLYNPQTGSFLSLDPVPGGGATPYAYPDDPINVLDLNGEWWNLCGETCRRIALGAVMWSVEHLVGNWVCGGFGPLYGILCDGIFGAFVGVAKYVGRKIFVEKSSISFKTAAWEAVKGFNSGIAENMVLSRLKPYLSKARGMLDRMIGYLKSKLSNPKYGRILLMITGLASTIMAAIGAEVNSDRRR